MYDDIENYYLRQKEQFQFKINNGVKYTFSEKNGINYVEIIDHGKLVLKAEYSLIGLYNVGVSVWYWGWNIAMIDKSLIQKIKKIKKYYKTIKAEYHKYNAQEIDEIYYFLRNGNFYISQQNVLKIVKLALFLTKSNWYLEVMRNDQTGGIQYIFIDKVVQVGGIQ